MRIWQLITNSDAIKVIEEDGTVRFVPNDPRNTDRAEYEAWLAINPENQPLPAE